MNPSPHSSPPEQTGKTKKIKTEYRQNQNKMIFPLTRKARSSILSKI
jgi:hypothetical protein